MILMEVLMITRDEMIKNFDHGAIADLVEYAEFRKALNDLANVIYRERDGLSLAWFVDEVRNMVLTMVHADCCDCFHERRPHGLGYNENNPMCTAWPFRIELDGHGGLKGYYRCACCGHLWPCWYAVNTIGL